MTPEITDTPGRRMPDTYLVIAGVALFVFVLSYLVTPGSFTMTEALRGGTMAEVVDPDTFRYADDPGGAALFSSDGSPALFNAVYEGLTSGDRMGGAVGIMAFILLVGGAFGVVLKTGSVHRALERLIAGNVHQGPLLLVGLFAAFSLGGAVFGMSEETIPFVLMLVPVMQRLGYDSITALLVCYVATQIGFATSWMNPFSVAIAQGIADVPLLSGMPLRLALWTTFTLAGIGFTLRYAARVRVEATDASDHAADFNAPPLTIGDRLVLLSVVAVVAWIVYGVVVKSFYLPEIATQFVVLGVAAGIIGCTFRLDGMDANGAMAAFRSGAMDLLPAALIVGFARGIVYLMGGDDPSSPSLLNTLLHHGSESLGGLPGWLAAWGMYFGQSVFNFFVTSGSGQAALTMPLMAPLADLIGVTRQVAVLAFQLGDGLTNLLVPTSAALMGCLGAAHVEWLRWVRVMLPFFGVLVVLASGFVIVASLIGYS